jgi:hypothetical protein
MERTYLIMGFIVLVGLVVSSCDYSKISESCQDFGGQWSSQYNECEQISAEECETLGGTFDGCASACRNNPQAELCAQVCIPLCSF